MELNAKSKYSGISNFVFSLWPLYAVPKHFLNHEPAIQIRISTSTSTNPKLNQSWFLSFHASIINKQLTASVFSRSYHRSRRDTCKQPPAKAGPLYYSYRIGQIVLLT